MGHCIQFEENETHNLGIPVFLGYPVVLINQSMIAIKGWLLPFPNKLNFV